jgi:hypothetical protein
MTEKQKEIAEILFRNAGKLSFGYGFCGAQDPCGKMRGSHLYRIRKYPDGGRRGRGFEISLSEVRGVPI